ncbi:hypothetical protein [robinz microvirus RP_165]|nr:hypothetical protein [robinz microvirus RP_165]
MYLPKTSKTPRSGVFTFKHTQFLQIIRPFPYPFSPFPVTVTLHKSVRYLLRTTLGDTSHGQGYLR